MLHNHPHYLLLESNEREQKKIKQQRKKENERNETEE